MKLDSYRNSFLNFSLPLLQQSEPGPVQKHKIHDKLEVSVWDQWKVIVDEKYTLGDFFELVKKEYQIWPQDLMLGNKPIFFSAVNNWLDFKDCKLLELLEMDYEDTVYCNVICTLKEGSKEILENIPCVKFVKKEVSE